MSAMDAAATVATLRTLGARTAVVREVEGVAGDPTDASSAAPAGDAAPDLWLPDAFWQMRPWLADLHRWCLSRGFPPDTTLAACLARYAAFLPKGSHMNTGAEDPETSLNLLVNLVGRPGSGKSSSLRAAKRVVPTPGGLSDACDAPLGTGEGLAEAFMATVKDPDDRKAPAVRKQVRFNAFLSLDEGQVLQKLDQRKGTIILQTLRSTFMGEPIGQLNASDDRKRVVTEYHLGLAFGWQTGTVRWLLGDEDCGTPQRFVYSLCNKKRRPTGDAVAAPLWERPPSHMAITFCRKAQGEILDHWEADHETEYDVRTMVIRAKIAALIAAIETKQVVDDDTWALAGMITDTSTAVRKWLQQEAAEANHAAVAERIAEGAARAETTMMASRNAEANATADEACVLRYVTKKPGCTARDIRANAFKGPRRLLVEAAIARLVNAGKVVDDNGRLALRG